MLGTPVEEGSRPSVPAAFSTSRRDVLTAAGVDERGLSGAEAAAWRARWRPNLIPTARPPGVLTVFVRQFASSLIYVLAFAAGLSIWLDEWADAGFIAVVLLLNAGIGAFQEHRAQRSADALRQLVTTRADVRRDGDLREVAAADLVVGDIVLLGSGDKVPADIRLLETLSLRVDESPLTGESAPVDKDADASQSCLRNWMAQGRR